MANRFFVGDIDADTNDAGNWSATSGGAGGAGIPGVGDDAFWDANSPDCDIDATLSVLSADFTGYTNEIDGLPMAFVLIVNTGGAILENTATYTRFTLRVSNATATVDFGGATIKIFEVENGTGLNHTVTLASGTINLTSTLAITTSSTGNLTVDFGVNDPDVNLPNLVASEGGSGAVSISFGAGTWLITGNSFDLSGITGTTLFSTGTIQINMGAANFTWFVTGVGATAPNNVIINFNQVTNHQFNSTTASPTVISVKGFFEVHVLGSGNLEIDFRTYTCPDGFISEESSTGVLNIDGTTEISVITCLMGIGANSGANKIDLRGLTAITLVGTLTFGNASYTLYPGAVPFNNVIFDVTPLTLTTHILTIVGDTFDIRNKLNINFTNNPNSDSLNLIFTDCIVNMAFGTYVEVNNKHASATLDLTMGDKNWTVPANNNATNNNHGMIFPLVDTLVGTTGITTITIETTISDFDLNTMLNDTVIRNSIGATPSTVTWATGKPQTILGSLTLEIFGAGDLILDYNTAKDFEIIGNFMILNTSGAGSITLNMGVGLWKMGGDITIGTGAQITLVSETSNLELDGLALQTVIFDNTQMNTITVTNVTNNGIIFDDATDFNIFDVNAATSDINIKFKENVTHLINILTLSGTGSNRIILRSKVDGTQWRLTTTSGQVVNHVDVKDSDAATSAAKINATDKMNIDSGNNIFWNFAPTKTARIVYDYSGLAKNTKRIVYDYNAFFAKATRVVYDYSGLVKVIERIVYDYLKREPDNVRIILNPYSQDSVRLNWAGFVPPANYSGEFFYGVYIEGEPYEVDIQPDQTWMDLVGLVNLETVIIDVVIQTFFGQRFNFDFETLGDRVKVTFKESSDPNISRYIFYGDAGDGSIDFTKEIGEIIVAESKKDVNTGFIPEGS